MKKANLIWGLVCLISVRMASCHAQAPVNDDFTNATVLTGNNVVFSGNLTGSTAEPNEGTGYPFIIAFSTRHSVWWSWTAPQSGPVTIIANQYSKDTYDSGNGSWNTFLSVYSITNGTPENATPVVASWLEAAFNKLSVTFSATAATTYQIQFADINFGAPTLQADFQLLATNLPIILDPPAGQTIQPGGSALFTVMAEGIRPLIYQWCTNGVAVPGAMYPMLPLDKVTSGQAAAYSVIVSNATGVITSQVANLTVTTNLPSPLLSVLGQTTNGFAFSLAGDSGRYWRIESSTDLVNWQPEQSFPSTQVPLVTSNWPTTYTSAALTTNSMITLVVPSPGAAKFLRARNYVAPNDICNNNLKRIRFAKVLWARDSYQTESSWPVVRGQTPEGVELDAYGLFSATLSCPVEGGTEEYWYNSALIWPTCPVPSHILEEPR